jgi:hypothetical protein
LFGEKKWEHLKLQQDGREKSFVEMW